VSYFFQLASQDPTILLSSSDTTDLYIRRAATALVAVADYRKLVCSGQLPCETIGRQDKIPLCSTAFKYLFHACRIPLPEQDAYRIYDPSQHTHCIVACQGQFFAVDFVDPNTGDALPIEMLQHRLERCVRLAEKESNDDHEDAPIKLGWLTSSDRDSWSNSRTELIRIGDAQMEAALTLLESGAFLLCLDSEVRECIPCKNIEYLLLSGQDSFHNFHFLQCLGSRVEKRMWGNVLAWRKIFWIQSMV
jgi:carnitine O-acetyltransferase